MSISPDWRPAVARGLWFGKTGAPSYKINQQQLKIFLVFLFNMRYFDIYGYYQMENHKCRE
jgi:hypothetical protein